MRNNVRRYTARSQRRVLTFAILLVALVALPAFAVQNPNINLRLNSSFNGYTVENSANGMEVRLVGEEEKTRYIHIPSLIEGESIDDAQQEACVLANNLFLKRQGFYLKNITLKPIYRRRISPAVALRPLGFDHE